MVGVDNAVSSIGSTGNAYYWGDITDASIVCLTNLQGKLIKSLYAGGSDIAVITANWEVTWVSRGKSACMNASLRK